MAYKILWYSIPTLHDNTNGAAIHNKILLEALAARGIQVKVLNAMVADDVRGLAIFNRIAHQLNDTPQRKYLQFTDAGVEYVVIKTKGHLAPEVTTADQGQIFSVFVQFLEKFQPDVVMGYSADLFSCILRHEAKIRGIPVVYALCNGLHHTFSFADCDLIFSPSEATAKLYHDMDGIDVKAVGQFIYRDRVTSNPNKRDPKYITLVNPAPEKGLAIFVKLAMAYHQKHPEQRFLVVKSVGNYQRCIAALHYADGAPFLVSGAPNPIPMIDVAEHTDDIRLVYALSKVVVTPSVWHESWGCVATEAIFNDIPVLSSKSGGLPEAVREGGILLDAPASTQKDYNCLPNDAEIAPWVEALERLVNEDWTEQCRQASSYNDLNQSVDRLMTYLEPLLQKGQRAKRPLDHSFFFCDRAMKERKQNYAIHMPHLLATSSGESKEKLVVDENDSGTTAKTAQSNDANTKAKSKDKSDASAKGSKNKNKELAATVIEPSEPETSSEAKTKAGQPAAKAAANKSKTKGKGKDSSVKAAPKASANTNAKANASAKAKAPQSSKPASDAKAGSGAKATAGAKANANEASKANAKTAKANAKKTQPQGAKKAQGQASKAKPASGKQDGAKGQDGAKNQAPAAQNNKAKAARKGNKQGNKSASAESKTAAESSAGAPAAPAADNTKQQK